MKLLLQFVRFTGVGVTCFAIDYALLILLTEIFDLRYIYSAGISFIIATVINYFLSVRFVYEHKSSKKYDAIVFIVLGVLGLGLNQVIMWCFVEHVAIDYRITKFISGIIVSFYNFTSRKLFLERNK